MHLAEMRLQCLDRARQWFPEANPTELTRIAETLSRYVADGNAMIVVRDDDGWATRPAAPAYRRDPIPFNEAEIAAMICGKP